MHCTEEDAEIRDVSSEDELPGIEDDAADDSSYNSDGGSSQNSDFESGVGAAGKHTDSLLTSTPIWLPIVSRQYSVVMIEWHSLLDTAVPAKGGNSGSDSDEDEVAPEVHGRTQNTQGARQQNANTASVEVRKV